VTTTPLSQSHWQRGCDDGRAGRPRRLPFDPAQAAGLSTEERAARYRANEGYNNGYDHGATAKVAEDRAAARAAGKAASAFTARLKGRP
jgi:hypothetical protein